MKETITSFENITLRLTGISVCIEYEITMKGEEARVAKYGIMFNGRQERKTTVLETFYSKERMIKLLNDCDLLSWDGFSGYPPKRKEDKVVVYELKAIINGRTISASSSEIRPEHYQEFNDGLNEIIFENREDME